MVVHRVEEILIRVRLIGKYAFSWLIIYILKIYMSGVKIREFDLSQIKVSKTIVMIPKRMSGKASTVRDRIPYRYHFEARGPSSTGFEVRGPSSTGFEVRFA